MNVHFTSPFVYRPKPTRAISYPAGFEGEVSDDCAEQAIAAGKARTTFVAPADSVAPVLPVDSNAAPASAASPA